MKILLSALLILAFVFSNQAQAPRVGEANKLKVKWFKDGWILDGGVGVRTFGKRSDDVEKIPGLSLQGGLGYMFDDIWGIRGRIGYYNHQLRPNYSPANAPEGLAHSMALSLTGVADLVPWITGRKGTTWHLNAYAGAGWTTAWNKEVKNYVRDGLSQEFMDPAIKGNDDMGHLLIGITPQYHLSSRFALTADILTFMLLEQDFTYDWNTRITGGGPGAIMNFSFGFIWYPHF